MKLSEWKEKMNTEEFLEMIRPLYAEKTEENDDRYRALLDLYATTFSGEDEITLFSAPGRTEIGGNHTDHENGRVLAASVDLDSIAAASRTDDNRISILSEGYPMCMIDLDDLSVQTSEVNTTAALIRGVAARFASLGCNVGGFRAVVSSTVLPGSGLSSSAAFEVLVGNIINHFFFGDRADAVLIAQIGQYAENEYFGKPSGLMDQTASSVGNLITIDFEDPAKPVVKKLDVDFEKFGLKLCIINCWASHADLTDEYAAVPVEEQKVAGYFGKKVLRQVPKEEFMNAIPKLRKEFGDRAVLRCIHFYGDNERVSAQVAALEKGDVSRFLALVNESGRSSWMYLQNIVPLGANVHQEMAVALALCDELLQGKGAFRVHGGGFAGTCQAFVPVEMIDAFTKRMNELLGAGSCHVLNIRPVGGTVVG
ncbi:MAG TPA: galactokinase [Lachnospiraceae bacterium]|nr:galactokinase [Lachnospiraceae bacterium]